MTIETLKERIPNFAKDIRINIGRVLTPEGSPGLTLAQIWGSALASAYATKSKKVINIFEELTTNELTNEEIEGAKSASTIMAMNNVYYRTTGMLSDPIIGTLQTGLRMQVLANPGIPIIDFEIYSLAVSAINSCQHCIDSHAKKLLKSTISHEGIQSIIRISAIIAAIHQAVAME